MVDECQKKRNLRLVPDEPTKIYSLEVPYGVEYLNFETCYILYDYDDLDDDTILVMLHVSPK